MPDTEHPGADATSTIELPPLPVAGVTPSAADLASAVLEEESRRASEQAERERAEPAPDDGPIPGVGAQDMSTRQAVRQGGAMTLAILLGLNVADEFDRAAIAVLAPDIQNSLNISDTWIGVLSTLGGALLVLAFLPIGYLADRYRRMTVVAGLSAVLGVFVAFTGVIQQGWHLAVSRIGTGFGKGGLPAFNSVLADAYPIAARARIFAIYNMGNPIGQLAGPTLAGAIAATAGGAEGWRWAFLTLALPTLCLAAASLLVKEPPRGANETQAVFGTEEVVLTSATPSISAAFERLRKIKTFYYILVGLGVMGFALFAFSIYFSLFLEEAFQLDALQRGYVISLGAIGGVAGAPLGGQITDRLFRRNPAQAVTGAAALLLLFGFGVIAMYMPNLALVTVMAAIAQLGVAAAISGLMALIASIVPFRLRGMGYAMAGIYMFFIGAFFGAVLTGQLSDAFGPRTALTIMVPPSLLIGAATMAYGSRFIKGDIRLAVEELQEEQRENRRIREGGDVPMLQVRNLDFSYGPLQVLFDVSVDVWPGETLALLGTNGAGKSTLLRAVSGLGIPDRGVIRVDGQSITFADTGTRVRQGVVQVPGGKAVFPSMSVAENLVVGAHTYVWDRDRLRRKFDEVLELFPKLRERLYQPAGTLSGGEQQMLAIAKGLLLDPKILLIDELSIGLAPIVVQDLLVIIEQLKAQGLTIVVVEQSVNIALKIADRAVFMEKGRVRFEGPAHELLERDDLVRAVFLGGEGG